MRVLMLGWEFPPHISGGLGTACAGMTSALIRRGTEVTFILPRTVDTTKDTTKQHGQDSQDGQSGHIRLIPASGTTITRSVYERIERNVQDLWQDRLHTYALDAMLFPYDTPESYAERMHWQNMTEKRHYDTKKESFTYTLQGGYGPDLMAEVHRFSRMVAAISLREDFDVIHAHDWMTYPAGMLARALTGRPLVVHIHATEHDRSGVNVNAEVAAIERAGLHAADKVIAVSHLTKHVIMDFYGVPEYKIEVVHNAVARHEVHHKFTVPERLRHEKRVLFLGRVTFQKGPDYFIEAARMVLERMDNVRFYMAGSGDLLPKSIRRVGKLRMGSRFHFAGFLRGTEVDRMFALSDLYVMPSVSEPFGITPLEAMLYDVPVLLSKQSGVAEVLQHALKANFWDTRDMADKICAVLRYPCLAGELVKNCREEMKNIRWVNVADQLNRIYQAVSAA